MQMNVLAASSKEIKIGMEHLPFNVKPIIKGVSPFTVLDFQ